MWQYQTKEPVITQLNIYSLLGMLQHFLKKCLLERTANQTFIACTLCVVPTNIGDIEAMENKTTNIFS